MYHLSCMLYFSFKYNYVIENVPILQVSSPCLRYLLALEIHLLRSAILHHHNQKDEDEDEDEGARIRSEKSLQQLQHIILSLASRVFMGAYEVSIVI